MKELWPAVTTESELDSLKQRGAELMPGVKVIADRHGLDPVPVRRYEVGSLPVFEMDGDRVLKLYPGIYADDHMVEAAVMGRLEGGPSAPRRLACGEVQGWRYILMSKLEGRDLATAWADLKPSDRRGVAEDLGRWLAELHCVAWEGLELAHPPWSRFIAKQLDGATQRQRGLGLGEPWLSRMAPFLDAVSVDRVGRDLVLLHTEIAREHVFVAQRGGRWRVTGVLDFEPSMIGSREYEFASVGMFASLGDAGFLRALLLAYGFRQDELDHTLRRRFMAYTLLHRYSHLGWYLRRMPPGPGVECLEALADEWWAW